MNRQQILDAIDAEIKAARADSLKVKLGNQGDASKAMSYISYVTGLRFARDLVEKAEVTE